MTPIPLYPLRFEPIFQHRIWGGRRLASLLHTPLPDDQPFGEAWLLSDRDDYPSVVAEGPLKGQTLAQLLTQYPDHMLGKRLARKFHRFPLLLKFLDARDLLSVQVHPSDHETQYLPAGENGKTEAWVVLEADPESRIYAGLKPSTTEETLWEAITDGTVADHLASFKPKSGDGILLQAGTVHSLGGALIFEVQQNSDVTFRLYDWDHADPYSGRRRELQVKQAMACLDFTRSGVGPVTPVLEQPAPVQRERLFQCEHFDVWRLTTAVPFLAGKTRTMRLLVCLAGEGHLKYEGAHHEFVKGDLLLLPAVLGTCVCRPHSEITLLEISLPEAS